ncbi:hypothetical protein C5E26_07825 [Pectobacterium parmentieri]|nr:hypothetical protein C5E26_07825 [Pectobacterium parmentieri]AYH27162.1 hypothetical protein C5E20_08465 [Pectobacterium parmentieri]
MGYKMAELFNTHTAPVTVTDAATGQRITIQRGHSALVSGDFRNHLFVTAGMIRAEHDESDTKPPQANKPDSGGDGGELDKTVLREQYESLLGKKAPSAASAETLQKAIDEAQANKPDSGGDNTETE